MNKNHSSIAVKLAVLFGASALIGTNVIVVLSVIGRHIAIPLPGSVEIVEMLIVVVASTSILYATVIYSHASAKLLIDRVGGFTKQLVESAGLVLGATFCLALTIGNGWLLYDYWSQYEVSPLLSIPIKPFRILVVLCLCLATLTLLKQLLEKNRNSKTTIKAASYD